MLGLTDVQIADFRAALELARGRPGLASAVRELYADVQRQVDLRKPRCDASGRCCRFEEFGHRLFVTTLELACFAEERGTATPAPSQPGGCPFQANNLCSVHTIRPFGCRMFYCDPTATEWQQDLYEQFHLRLRKLHQDMDVPYFYVEWREALRIGGLSD